MSRVDRGSLTLGERIGHGGQGAVFRVANRKINQQWDVVYKEYNHDTLPDLRVEALESMAGLVTRLPAASAEWLCERTAWPAEVVESQGKVTGFLMREVPDRFRFDLRNLGADVGNTRRLANLEFLLNEDAYVAQVGLRVSERDRLRLLADLASTLSRLHAMGIAVGDLSPKNLLLATSPEPACFIIDCDAMRLHGKSVLPQVETPDWQVPEGEEKGTRRSDVYKLGLLAARMFARDQSSTDPVALAAIAPELGNLARASLEHDPALRPAPGQWAEHLMAASESAGTAHATAGGAGSPAGTPPGPGAGSPGGTPPGPGAGGPNIPRPRGTSPNSSRDALVGIAILVAIIVMLVVPAIVANVHTTAPSPASLPSAITTSADSGPSDGPSSPSDGPSSPPDTPAPSDDSSSPPDTPTPPPDPSELDSAGTDPTPLTPDALLPSSITDSNHVAYTRTSGSVDPCLDSSEKSDVYNALSASGCSQMVVGTYAEENASADQVIMIDVWVVPLSDTQTASSAYGQLKSASVGDWGIWCPDSGAGSGDCTGSGWTSATQEGYTGSSHRYVTQTMALYANLSDNSSLEPWLTQAASAASDAAGPQSFMNPG